MQRRISALSGIPSLLALIGSLAFVAAASARPGMVTTKDHHTFLGEIDENATPGHVDVNSPAQGKISLDARNVEKVTYFSTARDEFDARLGALDRKDVASRVTLANFAMEHDMNDQARQVLVSALAIEPNNRVAADLLQRVNDKIKAANPPVTQPTTAAVVEAGPAAHPGQTRARRLLTPSELNYVRQLEWQANDASVRVQLGPGVSRHAVDLGLMSAADAARMSPQQIGYEILQHGPPGLIKGVKISTDPQTLFVYRQQVERFVVSGCAAGACHGTDKGGQFYLFTAPENETTSATNFVILQEFTHTVKGVEYSMVDRTHPAESLLVQFALPPDLATIPHPAVAGYKGAVRSPAEVRMKQVQQWMSLLAPIAPDYNIDLSVEPKAADDKNPADTKVAPPTSRPAPLPQASNGSTPGGPRVGAPDGRPDSSIPVQR